jgi:hypothetical protein
VATVTGAFRRLHDAHALVRYRGSTEIWAANPFCLAPTPHRVTATARRSGTPLLHQLAQRWWGSRLDADWAPRPRGESQAILTVSGS